VNTKIRELYDSNKNYFLILFRNQKECMAITKKFTIMVGLAMIPKP
jgi:hypothetical protein